VLTTFVDGIPPPGTPRPKRRLRRVARIPTPPPPPPEFPEELLPIEPEDVVPRYASYDELSAALPRDLMGNIDWVAAAEQKLIEPQPGIDEEAQEFPQLPLNVRLDPGIPQFEVTFPHAAHTYWLRCDNCHPQIFQMRAGADPITMAKIFAGEYCGRCHGKVAFPPQTGCPRCHTKLGGASG
jgi:c(7)-type cytochrome triheme protein